MGVFVVSELIERWSVKVCVHSLTDERFTRGELVFHVDRGRLDKKKYSTLVCCAIWRLFVHYKGHGRLGAVFVLCWMRVVLKG